MTLIELMVVLGITVLLLASIGFAYGSGMQFQQRVPQLDAEVRRVAQFEDHLRRIVEGAYLTSDATDVTSYFEAISNNGDQTAPDTLVFTTLGAGPNAAFLQSTDEFETLNQKFGPQGGLAEVGISTVPVGSSPVENALYVRTQRPADGDPTQGGLESVLIDNVESFSFEFFDGTEWVTEWDSVTQQRRLPAAVRFTYRFIGDDQDRELTVRLPLSDVTPENPIVQQVGG